jgi:hypothetical protein
MSGLMPKAGRNRLPARPPGSSLDALGVWRDTKVLPVSETLSSKGGELVDWTGACFPEPGVIGLTHMRRNFPLLKAIRTAHILDTRVRCTQVRAARCGK